ncbi:MAG: histone [Candidatus Hodarchaeota archaeon]
MPTDEENSEDQYCGLANARCERFLRQTEGARISEEAIITLNRLITQIGIKIAEKANELALADKRKTVKDRDILTATTLLDYPLPVQKQPMEALEDDEEDFIFDEEEEEE